MENKYKPGTRVMVYDVSLPLGQAVGYVAESKYTRHEYEVAVRVHPNWNDLYWVHKKQCRLLKKKKKDA